MHRDPAKPHRWDTGKEFQALVATAGLQNIRIHDLRHAAATMLMTLGIPDSIVRKITCHRSRELEHTYRHTGTGCAG